MKYLIEQLLISAKLPSEGNKRFVAQTMTNIKELSADNVFDSALKHNDKPKKYLWAKRISQLPTVLIVTIAIFSLLLLSGTAYAAYRVWFSPEATVQSVKREYGRSQALISLKNCSSSTEIVQIEINSDRTGTAKEAAVQQAARCELAAMEDWAASKQGSTRYAFTTSAINGKTLTVTDSLGENTLLNVTNKTEIVTKGLVTDIASLRVGDVIGYINNSKQQTVGLVRLTYPIKYYSFDRDLFNTYHVRDECVGNIAASCIDVPKLDVLRNGEGGANPETQGVNYRIQGKLISYSPSVITLQSSSNEIYTVKISDNALGAFNEGNPYGAIVIEPGDVLEVFYSQNSADDPKYIEANQYHSIELLLKEFDKTAKSNLEKYRY